MPALSVTTNANGWQEMSLGEFCEIYQPKTISRKQMIENGEYPVFGANGVIGRYNEYNHENSELLITCRGATCGSVNVSLPKSWITGNAMVVRPDETLVLRQYLQYAFQGPINLSSVITGSAQPQITRTNLSPVRFAFPSLSEQQRIVSILDEAFENISNSSKRVEQKLLDSNELLQSITHSIITPEDHSYDEYALEELTHKITKGSSPKWQGVSYIDEPGVLFVTSENVGRNQMIYKKTKFVEDKFNEIDSKSILQKGDVLTNIVGASIGRTAVFDKDDNSNINQAVCLIRCNEEKLVNKYLAYLLNSHFFVQILHDNEVNTARANLSLGFFRSLIIPVPTISEQYEIIEKLDSVYSNISKVELTLEQESRSLNELRRSILQEAFNGTL